MTSSTTQNATNSYDSSVGLMPSVAHIAIAWLLPDKARMIHSQRQRYRCKSCQRRFDDLTLSVFSGHHQPLKVWMHCLYLMSLNLSNLQIAQELDLNKDDVQKMTQQLRETVDKKRPDVSWKER